VAVVGKISGRRLWVQLAVLVCGLWLAATAGAEGFSWPEPQESVPPEWPIEARCSASDVNLRNSGRIADSKVVGSLQFNDLVYVKKVHQDDSDLVDGYPFAEIITDKGRKGFVNLKFLTNIAADNTRASRFRAAFNSGAFFTFNSMLGAFDERSGNGYTPLSEEEQNEFSSVKFKIALGNYDAWSYCEELNKKPEQRAVKVVKPGYMVAGLQVGESMDADRLAQFDKDMQNYGWDPAATDATGKHLWNLNGRRADGQTGPINGFGFHEDNGTIKDIFWCIYLVE
jgi:hypothetical protein